MNVIRRSLLVLGSVIIALVLIELFLRAINYNYYPMHIQVLATSPYGDDPNLKNDWRFYHMFEDQAFEYDPYLIWRPNPAYTIKENGKSIKFFNPLGFPGHEIPETNKDNTYRIAAIGDSNTLGMRDYDRVTGREVSWPGYLEYILGVHYQVINAGAWGYSSYQSYHRFLSVLPYKPSMILFGPSGNDGHEVTISDEQYSFIQIEKIQLLLHTRIARLLQSIIDKHVFARKSAKNYPLVPRVSLTEYAKILSDIIREARANHIHLVFLTRPYLDDHTTQFNAKSYNKLTQEVALQQSIPLIDIEGHFATTSALFNDPTHLNPEGLHQMAQYIIMNLQQMSLLPH